MGRRLGGFSVQSRSPKHSANSVYAASPFFACRLIGSEVYFGTRIVSPDPTNEQSAHFLYASTMMALSTLEGAEKASVKYWIASGNCRMSGIRSPNGGISSFVVAKQQVARYYAHDETNSMQASAPA